MIAKEKLIASFMDLPEEISMDDILDRIVLLQKIDIGLQQSAKGETFSSDEAKERLSKWLK